MNLIEEHDKHVKVFHDIIGCAYDVYNEFQEGLSEYPYQYGLKHLLRKLGYSVEKEYSLPLYLFGEKLEENYRCDLVLICDEGDIIIECKAVKFIDDSHRDQLKNYLLLTHCPFGILINFCKVKHQVFTEAYQYIADNHTVEKINVNYLGYPGIKERRPWQKYL